MLSHTDPVAGLGENETGHSNEPYLDVIPEVPMRAVITWYDLLGALPDASSEGIQHAGGIEPGPPVSGAGCL